MQWTGTVAVAKVLPDGSKYLVVGPYIDTANARLIAAAPELLDALVLVSKQPGFEPSEPYGEVVIAAIKKATQR